MDFVTNTQPVLSGFKPDWEDILTFGKGPRWLGEVFSNWAVFAAGARFVAKGTLAAYSFKMTPRPSLVKFSLPFTIAVAQPGVLHLVLDVGFYKGGDLAFGVIDDAYRRLDDWLHRVDEAALRQQLGPFDFDRLTSGGLITNITALVEMPPAWLTDP
jgi:hypothetical protein